MDKLFSLTQTQSLRRRSIRVDQPWRPVKLILLNTHSQRFVQIEH